MSLFHPDKTSRESGHVNAIAEITAKPGKETEVRALLEKLVPASRAEEGCKGYHLHVDRTNPARFYTYEEWASQAALETHLEGVKGVIVKAMPLLESPPKITPLDHIV